MTDHVKDQLCARIEELEKEKLELNEQLDALQEERDALAAHVARWKEWLGRDPEDDAGDWMDEGWAIAKESPTTSLARIKAEWQAEALVQLAAIASASGESWDADKLRHHAAVMSRQAGGGEQ